MLGLAVRLHDDPGPAPHGRHLQHGVLLRGVHGREDGRDRHHPELEEQPDAWGALDEQIATEFYPIIPTAFRNDLFAFGEKIGNPTGDGALGAPNYKDLYVAQ